MAGNGRFDVTTSSPDSGIVGSRRKLFGPSLDKSGSFREGGENRLFGNGPTNSRISGIRTGNVPSLSQCLMLDPILMGDLKYTRSGELKRILGFSAGSCSEETSFGAAHSRPPPPVAFDELQRYKDSVIDSNTKAKFRLKKLDEHLHKLNKYAEVVNSKKQARIATSSNDRTSTLNLKMGVQVHQNLPEVGPRRLEELAKNTTTNKRVRTSMAERAECRTNGVARQSLVTAKDRDLHKNNSPSSDLAEEKVPRLPAVGEGWDKKMKRRRSAGTSLARPVDTDGERKQSMHHKVTTEPELQSGETLGVRSGHANNISGNNKLDGSSLLANPLPRATQKHDMGNANTMKDSLTGINKDKPLAKENNGLNIRRDNHITSPSLLTKLKASRTPRSNFGAGPNSSLSSSRVIQNGEQSLSVNKSFPVGMSNIRKRTLPAGSSSPPPMAQWVGQRPQKICRTRRANVVSPVSNLEEGNITSEGCSPSDLSIKINSGATSGSLMSRGMVNAPQQLKSKCDSILSPAQISGGEESSACESVLKEKVEASDAVDGKADGFGQDCGPSLFVTKKIKPPLKEENSGGVRRQGQSGMGSFSMATISPIGEKLDNAVTRKPRQTTRPGGENNKSRVGRPSKKQLDRKGFSRRGPTSGSPDFLGDSDNAREELFAAAVSARNASAQACSSSFWKKFEPIFEPVSMLDTSCFSQQGDLGIEESNMRLQNQIESKESAKIVEFADQFQEFDIFCGKLDSEKILKKVAPLCQRVLSALILEDEVEELEERYMEEGAFDQYTNDVACDSEPIEWVGMEFEYGSAFGAQSGNRIFPCNGTINSGRNSILLNHPQNGFLHSDVGVFVDHFDHEMGETQTVNRNSFTVSSFDSQYEKLGLEDKLLLELESIGIHLNSVPDLDEGEDETLSQEIILLKQGLHNQVSRKKTLLERVGKSVQQGKEADTRKLEAIAMDKLVESAYRKLLATQGSIASKYGIGKVSKQAALSFSKRTIARCKAFEEKGISCFSEPAPRDALFAVSSLGNVVEAAVGVGVRLGSKLNNTEQHILHRGSVDAFENYAYQSDEAFAKSGPISNRGRKKEVLLDDVGGHSTPLGGRAKGKRSERERDGNAPKVGRPSLSNSRGERKPKAKPKQKIAQLTTPGNGFVNNFSETNDRRREGGLISLGTIPTQSSLNENQEEEEEEALDFSALPLPDLDTLDILGGNNDLGGLNSLLNFDDVGLLDHDSAGLEVPMDELSELNMF